MAKVEKTSVSAKYADLINRDSSSIRQDELNLHVQTAALQVEADLIQAARLENLAKVTLNNVIAMIPFSPKNYINAKRDLQDAQELIADLKAIKEELF